MRKVGQVKTPLKMERIVRRSCSSQSVSWKNDFLPREAGNRDETLNSNFFTSILNYEQSTLDKPRHLSVCVCMCVLGKETPLIWINPWKERLSKMDWASPVAHESWRQCTHPTVTMSFTRHIPCVLEYGITTTILLRCHHSVHSAEVLNSILPAQLGNLKYSIPWLLWSCGL